MSEIEPLRDQLLGHKLLLEQLLKGAALVSHRNHQEDFAKETLLRLVEEVEGTAGILYNFAIGPQVLFKVTKRRSKGQSKATLCIEKLSTKEFGKTGIILASVTSTNEERLYAPLLVNNKPVGCIQVRRHKPFD